MSIRMVSHNILQIGWTHSINSDTVLQKYASTLEYIKKDTIKYKCSTYHLTHMDYAFLAQELNLSKLVRLINQIYGTAYTLSEIWEVVRMEQWDFLAPHTDSFHRLQCVLYLNTLQYHEWWILWIDGLEIVPKYWDIIVFHGWSPHEVSVIKTNKSRVCITLWFQ